jgi:hypothetical protein
VGVVQRPLPVARTVAVLAGVDEGTSRGELLHAALYDAGEVGADGVAAVVGGVAALAFERVVEEGAGKGGLVVGAGVELPLAGAVPGERRGETGGPSQFTVERENGRRVDAVRAVALT